MAVLERGQTIGIVAGGMNLDDISKGRGWIQNLNHYQNAWETRDGFGVMGIHDTQMLVKAPVPGSNADKGFDQIGFIEVCGSYAFETDFGNQQVITILKCQGNNSILTHTFPQWTVVGESQAGFETTFYTAVIYDATTEEYLEEPLYRKTTEIFTQMQTESYPVSPTPREILGTAINTGLQHGIQESSVVPWKVFGEVKETRITPIESTRTYNYKEVPAFFFFQMFDRVYFGTEELGTFYYTPTIFSGDERSKRIENIQYKTLATGYSETSVIKRVMFQPSLSETLTSSGYAYLTDSEVGTIVDATVWDGRVVYLTKDKYVLFSQPTEDYAIIDVDFDQIQTEEEVTAIAEVNGRLMIFTKSETIILQPVSGQVLASGGRQVKVSSTVGCASAASKTRQGGLLWWADMNGAYASTGAGGISNVSNPAVDKFFKSFMENALTNYYTNNGWTTLEIEEQPKLVYSFDPVGLQVLHDIERNHIVYNFTELRIALLYNLNTKEWYLWNFESLVVSGTETIIGPTGPVNIPVPTIGVKQGLNKLWLSSVDDRLFGCFTEIQSITDNTTTFEDNTTYPTGHLSTGSYKSFPFIMTEYGRGGSLDRTKTPAEERRKISSGYVSLVSTDVVSGDTCPPTFFFEKGYWKEATFRTPSGDSYDSGTSTLSDSIYWVPVTFQLENGSTDPIGHPNKLYMDFRFDKDHWQPVFNTTAQGATGIWQLDIDLPTERLALAPAYGAGTGLPIAGTAEVACYDSATGLSSATGDEIRLRLDPNASMAPASYYWHPYMNIISFAKNPIVLLPFRRKLTLAPSSNAFSVGITPCVTPAAIQGFKVIRDIGDPLLQYFLSCSVYEWMETYTFPNMKKPPTLFDEYVGANYEASAAANKTQSVDWAYRSAEIGDGKVGLKPRGTIAQLMSRGTALHPLNSTWSLGQYNIAVSTNNKSYQGQILDYGVTGYTPANNITENKDVNINSIHLASSNTIVDKTFGNANITLGDTSDKTVGNYIIDSEIFTNKVTSDGTRGDRFSYTMFGHMRDGAEKLYFKSVDAIYRVIGSLRRTGR